MKPVQCGPRRTSSTGSPGAIRHAVPGHPALLTQLLRLRRPQGTVCSLRFQKLWSRSPRQPSLPPACVPTCLPSHLGLGGKQSALVRLSLILVPDPVMTWRKCFRKNHFLQPHGRCVGEVRLLFNIGLHFMVRFQVFLLPCHQGHY